MAVAITRQDVSVGDLRREAGRTRDAKAARRMLAIACVMEGQSREDAAETCGMDRQTLRDWVHRFNADGLVGAAVVLPLVNVEAMNVHLAEISRHVIEGAHAFLVLDQAGWHTSPKPQAPSPKPLATAEFATLRLRLLKTAGCSTETATRVRIALASAYPEAELFRGVARSLQLAGP